MVTDCEDEQRQPCQLCSTEISHWFNTHQTTIKQKPGWDHRTSTGQKTLEGISITDWESSRSGTDLELGRDMAISQSVQILLLLSQWRAKLFFVSICNGLQGVHFSYTPAESWVYNSHVSPRFLSTAIQTLGLNGTLYVAPAESHTDQREVTAATVASMWVG